MSAVIANLLHEKDTACDPAQLRELIEAEITHTGLCLKLLDVAEEAGERSDISRTSLVFNVEMLLDHCRIYAAVKPAK